MSPDTKMQIKVGALATFTLVVLVAFVLILSNVRFGDRYVIYVEFPTASLLRKGAIVKVSGITAGKVTDIEYLGDHFDMTGRIARVRVELSIDPAFASSLHTDAQFYISTLGLLGEKYIEIDPGSPRKKLLREGSIVPGHAAPSVQLAVAKGVAILDEVGELTKDGTKKLSELMESTTALVRTLNDAVPQLQSRLTELVSKLENTTGRISRTTSRIDDLLSTILPYFHKDGQAYVLLDNSAAISVSITKELPKLISRMHNVFDETEMLLKETRGRIATVSKRADAVLTHTDSLVETLNKTSQNLEPMLSEVRTGLKNLDNIGQLVKAIAQEVLPLLKRLASIVNKLDTLVSWIHSGSGTMGALIKDREIYDDIRELILDLKKNPWKALRKP